MRTKATEKTELFEKSRREFQLTRAKLFRLAEEQNLRREIAKDKDCLFTALTEMGAPGLELAKRLKRIIFNFSSLASYRGILHGHAVFRTGLSLGKDRARFLLVGYLQKYPKSSNEQVVRYLDRNNGRLDALRTRTARAKLAVLPETWEKALRQKGISVAHGEAWEFALQQLPNRVMPYFTRIRRMAQQPRMKNALRLAAHHKRT